MKYLKVRFIEKHEIGDCYYVTIKLPYCEPELLRITKKCYKGIR